MRFSVRPASFALVVVLTIPLSIAHSARIAEDEAGHLYTFTHGKKHILWPDFRLNEVMAQSYELQREGIQYVIWQSFTNDRSLLAMPVIDDSGYSSVSKFTYFSRDFEASSRAGRDTRTGSEIKLAKPLHLKNMTWDKLHAAAGDHLRRRESDSALPPLSPVSTPAFLNTPVSVFTAGGKFIHFKQYMDRSAETWTIENTVCVSNCGRSEALASGDYVGAIGNLPVALSIRVDGKEIEGTYRYSKHTSRSNLIVVGAISEDGSLRLAEYADNNRLTSTGSFVASLVDGVWRGTWHSDDNSRTLSFFAVQATL